jgi:parallel beta-helix repeat protein
MKKRIPGALLCMVLAMFMYDCKKSGSNDGGNLTTISNDTQSLQSQLDAGDVSLVSGKTYHVTGLNVTHSLNLNGATINLSSTTPGTYALNLSVPGVQVSNGTITGQWINQQPGDPSGYGGIVITASKCSVLHVNISSFSSYGIYAGPVDSTSVTYSAISNTGYIGFFYDSGSVSTSGGTFSNNTIDRSMLPPATIQQMAIGIRSNPSGSNAIVSGWVISNNIIKMPVNPADLSAQAIELMYCNNTLIENNTINSGSIGISLVHCLNNTVKGNTCNNVSQEGIEYADSQSCTGQNNVISGSGNVGELIDGSVGSTNIQITGDKISGTAQECIQAYFQTQNLTISNCTLTTSAPNVYAINLQKSNFVKVINSNINGNGTAYAAIMVDNCPGNLTVTGGTIANFQTSLIFVYNSTLGLVTNNISVSGVVVTSIPLGFADDLENGGLLGTNINVPL